MFEVTYVYTLISYIGLIYGPINSLPSTIVAAIQTAICARRIDRLISMDEMQVKPPSTIPIGTVKIKNFIGSWSYKKLNNINSINPSFAAPNHKHPSRVNNTNVPNNIPITNQPATTSRMESAWSLHPQTDDYAVNDNLKIKIPYKIDINLG
jgi:hypothetical protein